MIEWTRPYRDNPKWEWRGWNGHKSCLDCEHLEVAGMPNRRCSLGLVGHIWFCDAETEMREMADEGVDSTLADRCGKYKTCRELRNGLLKGTLEVYDERVEVGGT